MDVAPCSDETASTGCHPAGDGRWALCIDGAADAAVASRYVPALTMSLRANEWMHACSVQRSQLRVLLASHAAPPAPPSEKVEEEDDTVPTPHAVSVSLSLKARRVATVVLLWAPSLMFGCLCSYPPGVVVCCRWLVFNAKHRVVT